MSQPTFQGMPSQPLSGALGTSGAIGQSGALGAAAAAQTQQQNDLAAITAQQEQAAEAEQKAKQEKEKSSGWSWNLFQDVGQVWHDVETHTVAPAFHAVNWVTTNLVERPITTGELYAGHVLYQSGTSNPNYSVLQGSNWKKAWDESSKVSPAEGLVLAADANPITGSTLHTVMGSGSFGVPEFKPTKLLGSVEILHKSQTADPLSQQAADNFGSKSDPFASQDKWFKTEGDFVVDWYANPLNKAGAVVKGAKEILNNPIAKVDSQADALAKLNSPASQAWNEWALGKDVGTLASHSMLKGSGSANNFAANKMASLIATAKSPEEIGLIRQVVAGIVGPSEAASTMASITAASAHAETSASALDKLAEVNPNSAFQVSSALLPPNLGMKFALMTGSDTERASFLEQAMRANAEMVQADVNANADRWQQISSLRAAFQGNTQSTALANKLAELKGSLKYANTRDSDAVSFVRNGFYNLPVRIYQGLIDRYPNLINHRDDYATDQVRSWLNKSAVLSPEEKLAHVTRYGNATPADRAHVWNGIESSVYRQVGEKYGLDQAAMDNLLQTTRTRSGNFTRAAVSRAYGETKLPSGEGMGLLGSPESAAIMAPKFITQLEAGAAPMANLHNLENALDRMNQTGVLKAITSTGAAGKDLLYTMMDKVYGIWQPLVLMTGHRVYNHVGDDYLRGASVIGGMANVENLTGGVSNFLRNRYSNLTNNQVVRNIVAGHDTEVQKARSAYEGLSARMKNQQMWSAGDIPDEFRVTSEQVAAAKANWQALKKNALPDIQPRHRLGTGTFKIPGSNLTYDEAFGGSNGDYARYATSSHPAFMATVDEAAQAHYATATAVRSRNFSPISANENLEKHTAAYVHYIRNQMMPDPVAKQVVQGRDLNEVAQWLSKTAAGQAHMRALHIGDPHDWVHGIAEMVKTYLPHEGMRDAAVEGKFNAKLIERYMPTASERPDISADIASLMHGGDQVTSMFKRSMETMMKWTGTLPDDIMVRHPVYNSLYKVRLTDRVQSVIAQTGRDVLAGDELNGLMTAAAKAARNDLRNIMYDVSRFNDAGHTLRFISPFFNAWFNAMGSWSKLIAENPGLLARAYAAKRALWDSPLSVNSETGEKADNNTPLDKISFVYHMPKFISDHLGGLGTLPISAKTLVSPTYIDAIGNPGFGPIVSIPLNQYVLSHPELMNSSLAAGILNNMVQKDSWKQLVPSAITDAGQLLQMFSGQPQDSSNLAKNMWSIYQEQMWDHTNGTRTTEPKWSDIENQARYLTIMDIFVNRMMPLGFKPAPSHQYLVDEYRSMQSADPKNALQNFYDKHGAAGMVFTQSLSSDPSGIQATVGAASLANKYRSTIMQYPELGAAIVGPDGNGNFSQMAYDWMVAKGLRTKLPPQEAAKQAEINKGWAEYDRLNAQAQAQLAVRNIPSIDDPRARDLKTQLSNFVSRTGDPSDPLHNPAFYDNFGSYNPNAYMTRMQELLKIAQEPALLANPSRSDIRSLQSFSQIRDMTYAALQKRPAKTLKAASNSDLARRFDSAVTQLMQRDNKFATLYDRYLRKDDWKAPLGGY